MTKANYSNAIRNVLIDHFKKNNIEIPESISLENLTERYIKKFGLGKYAGAVMNINNNYIAYFDGSFVSKSENVEEVGAGYIGYAIKSIDGKLIFRDAKKVKVGNSHEAESLALLSLLNRIIELGLNGVTIYGDNKGLINSVNRRKNLKGRLPHILNRMYQLNVAIKWKNRDNNKYADLLCRLKRKGIDVAKSGGEFSLEELRTLPRHTKRKVRVVA